MKKSKIILTSIIVIAIVAIIATAICKKAFAYEGGDPPTGSAAPIVHLG